MAVSLKATMADGIGKRKRLSLKNKKTSAIITNNLKNIPENVEPEIICLSDEETVNCKQVEIRRNDPSVISILDISDEQLRELRIRLLALREQQSDTGYIKQLPELDLPKKEKIYGQRETTPVTALVNSDQEYSPLPQMCLACSRRKPINHDFDSVVNSILKSSDNENSSSDCNSPNVMFSDRTETCPPKQGTSLSDCHQHGEAVVTSKSPVLDFGDMSDFEEDIQERDEMKACEKGEQDVKKTQTTLKDGPGSSVEVETSEPCEVDLLSACPLCTMEFEKGTSQLDIDGHIAVCLSAAGDDATW